MMNSLSPSNYITVEKPYAAGHFCVGFCHCVSSGYGKLSFGKGTVLLVSPGKRCSRLPVVSLAVFHGCIVLVLSGANVGI